MPHLARLRSRAYGVCLVTTLSVLGCNKDKEAGSGAALRSAPEADDPPGACSLEATAWVEEQLASTSAAGVPPGVDIDALPLAPWKPVPSDVQGPVIVVEYEEKPGVTVYVHGLQETLARPSPKDSAAPAWVLAASADLPGSLIGPVFRALADAGAREGALLVRTGGGPARAQPRDAELMSRIEAELARRDPAQRAMHAASRLETLMAGCTGAGERFGALATMSIEERSRALPGVAREILVACDCPPWADEMVALLRAMTAGDEPTALVPVHLVDGSKRRPRQSWGELIAELGADDIPIEIDPASSLSEPLSAERTSFSTAVGGVTMERTRVSGALELSVVRAKLNEVRDEIRDCYRDTLRVDPLVTGRFVLGFAIEPDGSTSNIVITESTLHETAVTDCVETRASSWTFPSPGEGSAEVTTGYQLR